MTLYLILLVGITAGLMVILVGILLVPLLLVALAVGPIIDLIFVIVAAIKASNGECYRYPATIRFLT